jgi:RNA polymerase sigma-70 factor (sigma-E family)
VRAHKSDRDIDADFAEFVTARRTDLVRAAFLLVGDQHLAEDLVQVALARVYVHWRRISAAGSPDAYVRRVLVNAHLSTFRKRRVGEIVTHLLPERSSPSADSGQAERGDLMAALADLPARQRAVVVLRYWEDLSETAVAEAMGCTVGTVRSQNAKALARLRRCAVLTGFSVEREGTRS